MSKSQILKAYGDKLALKFYNSVQSCRAAQTESARNFWSMRSANIYTEARNQGSRVVWFMNVKLGELMAQEVGR